VGGPERKKEKVRGKKREPAAGRWSAKCQGGCRWEARVSAGLGLGPQGWPVEEGGHRLSLAGWLVWPGRLGRGFSLLFFYLKQFSFIIFLFCFKTISNSCLYRKIRRIEYILIRDRKGD
jgi:hypothetical protein